MGLPVEYLRMSSSPDTEAYRLAIVREYVKADLYYQTLNVKTVEEEPLYTVMLLDTVETAYKVYICPRGNLLYMQIYLIDDIKLL